MTRRVGFLDVAAYVWRYWRRHPLLVAGLVVGMLAATFCDILMPLAAGRLIDSLTVEDNALTNALWALAGFVALGLGYRGCRELAMYLWVALATRAMRSLVSDAFHRVQRFSTDWHANAFAGATVRKISRGMWAYDTFADTVYVGFFPAIVVLSGITLVLFLHWPLMGSFVLVAILGYATVSILLTVRYVGPANLGQANADSAVGAAMADAITCNATVKAFGAETREDRRFHGVATRWKAAATVSWTRMTNVAMIQGGMAVLLQLGLLGLALWFWAEGRATPGDVTFVMTSFFLVSGYLREIGMHVRHLQRAVNDMDDIVRFDRLPFGVVDRPDAVPLVAARGEIAFERVTFAYGNQAAPIYDGFSLRIAPGERVALVGESGSGKSTFVKLVQRLYDIDAGRILIDGQDIARATQESLRQAISLVPQDPILFHRSLAENIAYGRPDAEPDEIVAAARRAHAHDFIARLPQGYDTLVGERGVKLSGGERQRVAIARAFLADAPILILDEATSSLDSVTEAAIQEAIDDLMEGRTTIVIAHRLSTVRSVDRILVFHQGRIVEQGSHARLLAIEDGHYRTLYAVQARSLAG
jgi:ATP-binding cassette subfamily B protein